MKIIKRSGEEQVFDIEKIKNAIAKANKSVVDDARLTDKQINDISSKVKNVCEKL